VLPWSTNSCYMAAIRARLPCLSCRGKCAPRVAVCDTVLLRVSAAEALQDLVVDRKDEFKELTARCGALEADNAMLREILGAGAGGPVAPEPPAQRLPAPLSSSASSEGKELGRIRGQCEALRQVLRQREDEVGKERERTSQLRTAIKAAQKEYVKNMTRVRQELKTLENERHAQKERIQVQQQQLDDARQQVHADKKSLSTLRALAEALKMDLQRERSGSAQEGFLEERHWTPADNDTSASSPRGADEKIKSPRSPRGPGREKMAIPSLRLEHLAHANNANVSAFKVDIGDVPAESPRSVSSQRSPRDGDVGSLATRLGEMERKYKKECAARRADQLAMMEHIKSASMERLSTSQELTKQSNRCKELERQLADMRCRMQRSDASGLHRDGAQSSAPEERHSDKSQAPTNFLSSLLGVFSVTNKVQKPKPAVPGMDSPRGERISGAPIHETPSPKDQTPALSVHSSPSILFPLDTIAEASPSSAETSPTISSTEPHDAPQFSLSLQLPDGTDTGGGNNLGEQHTMRALGGGTHTSLRNAGCSPLSRAEAHQFALDPRNMDWRVVL